jgi:hypothetical protein
VVTLTNFAHAGVKRKLSMQQGSLRKEARRGGPEVWSFRWRERDGNGKTVLRRTTIGNVEEYSTEAKACRAIAEIIREVNSGEFRHQTSYEP